MVLGANMKRRYVPYVVRGGVLLLLYNVGAINTFQALRMCVLFFLCFIIFITKFASLVYAVQIGN